MPVQTRVPADGDASNFRLGIQEMKSHDRFARRRVVKFHRVCTGSSYK